MVLVFQIVIDGSSVPDGPRFQMVLDGFRWFLMVLVFQMFVLFLPDV